MRNAAILAVTLFAAAPAAGSPATYHVLVSPSRASFTSEGTLEIIVGHTSSIKGDATVDVDKPAEGARGRIAVQLATLKSGIDARDEDMRGPAWLDTDKFPEAVFELKKLEIGRLAKGKAQQGRMVGTITIRGITKEVIADVKATYFGLDDKMKSEMFGFTDDLLKIHATFPVKFTDFGMKVPQLLFYKLAEELRIDVDLTMVKRAAPAK
jgi:polyisoprenoid-binding protein YceI